MFVKNKTMKKILLLIAIGVSSLCVNAQRIYAYYENTDMKSVGDTITFYIDAPKAIIFSCISAYDNSDITNTFFFDYFDSKGRSHYKQVAKMWPDRRIYCRTNVGAFQANADYKGNPTGIEDEILLKIDSKKNYYTIQGVKIDSPDNYNGAMICNGKIILP